MTFQTFTGKQYLKIDIANNFGLDKENWDTRLAWFDDNEHRLMDLLRQAEEPALYYAGIQAWEKVKEGKPSSYPISLDATASGIQLLACLSSDRKAAQLCNVVDAGKRMDAYTHLYEEMIHAIGGSAKIDRKDTKNAIMTFFYNSTAVPKRVFGEGDLLNCFYDTMESNAPGPWEITNTMLAIWDNTRLIYDWVLPDNFHVKFKVMGTVTSTVNFLNKPYEVTVTENMPIEEGRSLGANTTHSIDGMVVREMVRRCNYDIKQIENIQKWIDRGVNGTSKSRQNDRMVVTLMEHYKASGFLSARILDYLDPANMGHVDMVALQDMLDYLPAKPFEVLTIHD